MKQVKPSSHFLADIGSVIYLFKRFLRRYFLPIAALILFNTVTGFLQAVLPLSIAPAVNMVLGEKQVPAVSLSKITLDNLGPTIMEWMGVLSGDFLSVIFSVAVLYITITVLVAVLKTLAFVLSAWVSGKTLNDLIVALHDHVVSLPLSFFNAKREGDVISCFTSDTTATVNLLDGLIRGIFQSLIQTIFLLIILFRTDPLLSIVTVGIGGGHFLITRLLSGWVKSKTRAVYDFYGRMTSALQESLQNIRVTKCFAAENFDCGRLANEAVAVRKSLFHFRIARYVEEPVRLVADALSVCAMLFLAYYAMSSGRLTKSGFGLLVFLASRVVVPISEFSKHFLSIFAVAGSADRLLEIFSIRSTMRDGDKDAGSLTTGIRFENVSFSHANGRKILDCIDLEIQKGEMVAIVGSSGAGKSTLCDLLLRLHDPESGRVLFNSEDIRNYRKKSYLQKFGVVPQESLLLNASVRENILYGRCMDRVCFERAIRIANAAEFIGELSEGVATMIGDRGVRLSGGQRQRLAIARAIYGMPEILVLDEATSALDTESERAVQRAIDNAIRSMTAVVVAHRLTTIMHADRIVVIKNGKIESSGSHRELLESSPTYRRLQDLQFRNHNVS